MKRIKINVPMDSQFNPATITTSDGHSYTHYNYKSYIYRSTDYNDIDTLDKVRNLQPVIIINWDDPNAQSYDVVDVIDSANTAANPSWVTYNGPEPNVLQTEEFISAGELYHEVCDHTFCPVVYMEPTGITQEKMFYYSMVDIDTVHNEISHISKVEGILVDNTDKQDFIKYQLYSCEDNTADNPQWDYVATSTSHPYEIIEIGDLTRSTYSKFGSSVVKEVPAVNVINAVTREVINNNFMVLKIDNPWQNNNQDYNYRKLKSFKVRCVLENDYSGFSEPTLQTFVPLPMEKMIIFVSENNEIISPNQTKDGYNKYEIIRKDGIFYDAATHSSLPVNSYNIPVGTALAVFNESSVQDQVKIQVEAYAGKTYYVTVYLMDLYRNYSIPKQIEVLC